MYISRRNRCGILLLQEEAEVCDFAAALSIRSHGGGDYEELGCRYFVICGVTGT